MSADRPLTPKQEAFCERYLVSLNATRAAKEAGYSERTAYRTGADLLKDERIQARIQALMAARSERTQITADRVLEELAAVGLSDVGELFERDDRGELRIRPLDQVPERVRRAIAGVKIRRVRVDTDREGESSSVTTEDVIEFKLWDKPGTLRTLAEHLGMIRQRVEHTGKDGGPIEHAAKQIIVIGDRTIEF